MNTEIRKHKGKRYLITDDLEEIEKLKVGDRVFFNKDANPCYHTGKERAKDLLTVAYITSDVIQFEEVEIIEGHLSTFDFFYRRKEKKCIK